MSNPKNPLDVFSTYQVRHILAAYEYTTDAENAELTNTSGMVGDTEPGGGIIIVNELSDDRFMIPSIVWKWVKYGPTGSSTTSMDGSFDIADRTGGQFIDWFRTNVVTKFAISTSQMTFVWKTYFMGTDKSGAADVYSVVHGAPLLLHIHEFNDIMNDPIEATIIRVTFTSAYNTTAQSPTLCKPYQITLTHKSGKLSSNTAPEIYSGGKTGLIFRSIEDKTKTPGRLERQEKSKPMKTLKEVFDALEFDLNKQPFAHHNQVQQWMDKIRNNYTTKINPIPKQERGDKLPIEFFVKLDPKYNEYTVDNRNLPFEQTEERAILPGVTSIPFRAGATITEMIETIMKYSRKVGQDAADPIAPKSFKVNLSHARKESGIEIHIKIKQIYIPLNTQLYGDTGPGEGALSGPLEFTFKSGKTDDHDITFLKTHIASDNGIVPLEHGDRLAIYGNRETIMGERIPTTARGGGAQFFKTEYSGLRLPIIPLLNNGLEDAVAGANVDIGYLVTNEQTSDHEIQIRGNPTLMCDMHRFPRDAAEFDAIGTSQYYKAPESYPMYLKIAVYLNPDSVIGNVKYTGLPELSYYTNHYEIVGIINTIIDGAFYQNLNLKKTDDII